MRTQQQQQTSPAILNTYIQPEPAGLPPIIPTGQEEPQKAHELALAKKNQELMLKQMEIRWQPQQTPAQQKAQRERERKRVKQCMKKMHIPKCVVDGVYKENKHQEDMDIKRKAYLDKLNPPRQDYPVIGGLLKNIIAPPPLRPYIQPDWEVMQKMFPNYKRTKCHQDYINEQQIQAMRNQFDLQERLGDDFYNPTMIKRYGGPILMEEQIYANADGSSPVRTDNVSIGSMIAPYPYFPRPYVIPRDEKCRGVDEKIEDDILPKATRTQCASMCMATNRKRMRGWQGGKSMTDKQYVKHLETQRDTPGTSSQEFQSLDTQIWNLKQSICEKEKMYKINCRKFEKKQKEQEEQSKLNKLLPFALAGVALYVLLD